MPKDAKFKRAVLLLSALFICLALYFFLSRVILKSAVYAEYGNYNKLNGSLSAEARIVGKRQKEQGKPVFDVVILSEAFRGEKVSASAKSQYEPMLSPGERCIVKLFVENSRIKDALILSPVRDRTLIILFLLFLFMIILLAGARGLRTIASLALGLFFLMTVFLPLTLRGVNPVMPGLIVSAVICSSGILIIGGWNRKSAGAVFGALAAFVIAGALPFIARGHLSLTGLELEFGTYFHLDNFFWYSAGLARVDFSDLLIAGILISCVGAVMDIAMTISTSVNELKAASPEASRRILFRAGMNVGTDVLAMMSITVLFVFIGANFELILLFYKTYGSLPALATLLNYEDISSEAIRILSCEIGLVLAVPLTALTSAALSGGKR